MDAVCRLSSITKAVLQLQSIDRKGQCRSCEYLITHMLHLVERWYSYPSPGHAVARPLTMGEKELEVGQALLMFRSLGFRSTWERLTEFCSRSKTDWNHNTNWSARECNRTTLRSEVRVPYMYLTTTWKARKPAVHRLSPALRAFRGLPGEFATSPSLTALAALWA